MERYSRCTFSSILFRPFIVKKVFEDDGPSSSAFSLSFSALHWRWSFLFVRNERGRKMITAYLYTRTHIFAIMIASHSITLLSLTSHLHWRCLSWNLEHQTSTERERERERKRKRARIDHKLNLHILILIFSCFSMTCVAVPDGFGDS